MTLGQRGVNSTNNIEVIFDKICENVYFGFLVTPSGSEALTISQYSITAFGSLSIRNSEEIHSLYSHGSKDGPDGEVMAGPGPHVVRGGPE